MNAFNHEMQSGRYIHLSKERILKISLKTTIEIIFSRFFLLTHSPLKNPGYGPAEMTFPDHVSFVLFSCGSLVNQYILS